MLSGQVRTRKETKNRLFPFFASHHNTGPRRSADAVSDPAKGKNSNP